MTVEASRHLWHTMSRIAAALSVLAVLSAQAAEPAPEQVPPAAAEAEAPAAAEAGEAADAAAPSLFVGDRTASRRLRLAEERLGRGDFDAALELLQSVLDAEEDVAVSSDDEGAFQSVKGSALALIGGLSAEGRAVYELKNGVAAKTRLAEAIASGNWSGVEEIARRYFHTEAGYEAAYRLAVRAQDRGESLQAALLLDRLAATDAAAAAYEPGLSTRAAAAWRTAGLLKPARAAAARAVARSGQALTLGDDPLARNVDADGLLEAIARTSTGASGDATAWTMFGGDSGRTGDAESITLAGGPAWSHDFTTTTEWDDRRETARAGRLANALRTMEAAAAQTGELTQPAFHPVTVGDVAVFRTLRNLRAVDLATGRFVWQTERAHDALFDRATTEVAYDPDLWNPDLTDYVSQHAWRSQTTGALSTDGRYVYGVEGAGRNSPFAAMAGRPGLVGFEPEPGTAPYSTLFAYDAEADGAVAWTFGGPPTEVGTSGQFVLGPPLPLGGRLYCLVEENAEIRLIVLTANPAEGEPRVAWSQTLVSAERAVDADPLRRVSGLSPSFGDGVLVCPTGAGAVVGIDLGGRHLLWGYQYPRNILHGVRGQNAIGNFQEPVSPDDEIVRWLDAVPRIVDGAVLLTPRDSDELHCLEAADGRLRWKRPRGTALYVAAVHDGKVVVVGRRGIEAFDLATGEPAWTLETPMPTGHGVRDGDLYHLPLSTDSVMTFRISTGRVLAESPLGDGVRAGNLIAVGGRLISQSTESVVGFRPLDEVEANLKLALRDGDDPEALALRGEDRLHRGETEAGLADLRAATTAADLPRARRLLAGVLLNGLRTDFAAYRRYAADLDRLADDPRQRAEYLRCFGDGLLDAGEPAAALESYVRLLDDGVAEPVAESIEPGVAALSDRVLAARVAESFAAATPADRTAMNAVLESRLAVLEQAPDTATLRRFATLFKPLPTSIEALRILAEREERSGDLLGAERARLLLAEAANAPGEEVPPRGAAADGIDATFDVAYRAEYIPDEINARRPPSEVEITTPVRIVGDQPAEFEGWQFELTAGRLVLSARDASGRTRWAVSIASDDEGGLGARQPQARFSGHLMALVVGSRLQMIDLLSDPKRPQLLWIRDLTDPRTGGAILERGYLLGNSSGRPTGPAGFAGAELLVYQIGATVIAVDAVSGEPVWKRSGMPANCDITGDRDFVLLQPAFGGDVHIVRTADGRGVAVRPASNAPPLPGRLRNDGAVGWVGTRTVVWRETPEGRRLECRDVARDRDIWSRDFAATALQRPVGPEELAVFDPATGKLDLVGVRDGETILTAEAFADEAVDRFLVLKSFGRYLLFTHRRGQVERLSPDGDWRRFTLNGLAYAFDRTGERLWSAAIGKLLLPPDQPAGLPVLVMTGRQPAGSEPSNRITILDVRTGELLAGENRTQPLHSFRTEGISKDGTIVVTVPDAKFQLSRVEGPLPPARGDTPDALDLPDDDDGVIPISSP